MVHVILYSSLMIPSSAGIAVTPCFNNLGLSRPGIEPSDLPCGRRMLFQQSHYSGLNIHVFISLCL